MRLLVVGCYRLQAEYGYATGTPESYGWDHKCQRGGTKVKASCEQFVR